MPKCGPRRPEHAYVLAKKRSAEQHDLYLFRDMTCPVHCGHNGYVIETLRTISGVSIKECSEIQFVLRQSGKVNLDVTPRSGCSGQADEIGRFELLYTIRNVIDSVHETARD